MTRLVVSAVRRTIVMATCALSVAFAVTAPAQADVTVPPEVSTALQSFITMPRAAVTSWVNWAQTQPMTVVTTAADGKTSCVIDAAHVTRCRQYDPKAHGKGYVLTGTDYTLADNKTQVFRYHGGWVHNSLGADTNPFTNTDRFYSYDYWLPWATPQVPVLTSVDEKGWYTVRSDNKELGDDQSPRTVVRVSPDGLHAQFLQLDANDESLVVTSVTLTSVPAIRVPHSRKQHLS
jgi:hypothetical protein